MSRDRLHARPFLLATLCSLLFVAFATAAGAQSSVRVELNGTVVPEDTTEGAYTLKYGDEEQLFTIEDVRLLGLTHPEGASGWDKLNEIGRRRVLLSGKDEAARTLMAAKSMSRRFVILGTLCVSNGMIAVESVREAEKEGEK